MKKLYPSTTEALCKEQSCIVLTVFRLFALYDSIWAKTLEVRQVQVIMAFVYGGHASLNT